MTFYIGIKSLEDIGVNVKYDQNKFSPVMNFFIAQAETPK